MVAMFRLIDRAGLDWCADVRALLDWAAQLDAALPRPVDLNSTLDRIGRHLGANPGGDIAAARDDADAAGRAADRRGPAATALKIAISEASNRAWARLVGYGEAGLIGKLAAPAVADVVAATVMVADRIPAGVETADAAVRAGATVAQAWAELQDLQVRWEALTGIVNHWRGCSIVPAVDDDTVHQAEYWFRRPEHGDRRLVVAIASGADPACLTAAEVAALHTERADPATPQRRATRTGSFQ